jgi:hypothetical protein
MKLASLAGFARLAPSLRFDLLVEAIARDYPTEAAKMRECDGLAQRATLSVFSNVVYSSPAAREVELWRVARTPASCVASRSTCRPASTCG